MAKRKRNLRTEILRFVESFVDENGYPPTYDEIRESVGLSSKSHVYYYLEALEDEGLIERTPRTPRGLRLATSDSEAFEVKIEGTVAAGHPITLADRPEQTIELTRDIADPRKDLLALRVRGESMVDDLVGDGDILIVERQSEAPRGQMAVVYLRERNEATLKRIFPEGERIRLEPAHPVMPAFYANARDVEIQGRVVAIVRRL